MAWRHECSPPRAVDALSALSLPIISKGTSTFVLWQVHNVYFNLAQRQQLYPPPTPIPHPNPYTYFFIFNILRAAFNKKGCSDGGSYVY